MVRRRWMGVLVALNRGAIESRSIRGSVSVRAIPSHGCVALDHASRTRKSSSSSLRVVAHSTSTFSRPKTKPTKTKRTTQTIQIQNLSKSFEEVKWREKEQSEIENGSAKRWRVPEAGRGGAQKVADLTKGRVAVDDDFSAANKRAFAHLQARFCREPSHPQHGPHNYLVKSRVSFKLVQ